MKLLNHIIAILVLLSVLSSCSKDAPVPPVVNDENGTIELLFEPTMNGGAYLPNQIFSGPNGLRMNLENFKFYLSDIYLHSGTDSLNGKEIALADMNTSAGKSIRISLKPGTYDALSFGIGVKPALNGMTDPDFNEAQFPIDHPLSIYNNMYWSWATGYIFSKMEGKIDTSAGQNQTPTYTWFYHTGMDTLYSARKFENLNITVEKGKTSIVKFGLEFNTIFVEGSDTLDMVENYFTHTTDNYPVARRVSQGLKNALFIKE